MERIPRNMKELMVNIPSTINVYSDKRIQLPWGLSTAAIWSHAKPMWQSPELSCLLFQSPALQSRWLLGGVTLGLRSDYYHNFILGHTYTKSLPILFFKTDKASMGLELMTTEPS